MGQGQWPPHLQRRSTASEERILLIACGALAREILTLVRNNGWTHLELVCLPAHLHLAPERIPAEVARVFHARQAEFARVFVVYADCGTGGRLQSLCQELGIAMIAGPHCYAFYDGLERFTAHAADEVTSFYLTDFLVRQFESFVIKPLGLDRHPELRSTYFGHYETLVYLAQTDDPGLDTMARRWAGILGLAYRRRLTGYGDLATSLARLVPEARRAPSA